MSNFGSAINTTLTSVQTSLKLQKQVELSEANPGTTNESNLLPPTILALASI
jgi:hypothetical protein